jgi:CHAT domain-containing protein/predicted negative regulator of RcsB-dependent stress response
LLGRSEPFQNKEISSIFIRSFRRGVAMAQENERCGLRQLFHRVASLPACLLLALWLATPSSATKPAPSFPPDGQLNRAAQNFRDLQLLEPGQMIEREITASNRHSYRLKLIAGQFLEVRVESFGLNANVYLFGPTGRELMHSTWLESPDRVWWLAKISGHYRLEVYTTDPKPGRYRMSIEALRSATAQDRLRVKAYRLWQVGGELQNEETNETLPKAMERFHQALGIWRSLGERPMEAVTLQYMAYTYASLGQSQDVIESASQALQIFQSLGERHYQANMLLFIGEAYHQMSEYLKAREHYQQAQLICQAIGDLSTEAWALNNIGSSYNAFGEKQTALEYYEQSRRAYQAAGEIGRQALEYTQIGGLYTSIGEKQQALDALKQAVKHWEIKPDPSRRESRTYLRLGDLYASLGEHQLALTHYQRALRRVREGSDPPVESMILHSLGRVHAAMGQQPKALYYLHQALRVRRQIKNRQGEANTLTYLGTVYFAQGDQQRALRYYHQALPLCREVGDRYGEAYTLSYLGEAYHALGQEPEAIAYLGQALALRAKVGDREGEANTRYLIARIKRDGGDLNAARQQIEKALELIESVRRSIAGQELRASYLATVRDYYEFYTELLMRLHERRPAEGFAALALQASERARARSLLETLAEAHADLRQDVDPQLLQREREWQQRINAKAEYRMRLPAGARAELAADAGKEIAALTAELNEVRAEIKIASPRYHALTQPEPMSAVEIQRQLLDGETLLLEFALGEERSYLWAVTPTTLDSYTLPGRAVIERAARRLHDLITARNPRPGDKTAAQIRARTRRADALLPQAAAQLSQMLLGPAASQLGQKRLLIVPQGALQLVPFAALPIPQPSVVSGQWSVANDNGSPTNHGPPVTDTALPLIFNHEIVYLPSASALGLMRRELARRQAAPKTVAVLADPVFSARDQRVPKTAKASDKKNSPQTSPPSASEARRDLETAIRDMGGARGFASLPRLSATAWEAEKITSLAPPGAHLKALNFKASRATALDPTLGQYRIVHFATHALVNYVHPELSGIVLSLVDEQGRPQDGFLRAHELFNLKLPAELVVLSACQTGLGREIKGEGMASLTRGFMHAGAARVMASLYALKDKETADFMARFYQQMLGPERLSPAAALRAAQLEMWQDERWRERPYYWAAFVLQGEYK